MGIFLDIVWGISGIMRESRILGIGMGASASLGGWIIFSVRYTIFTLRSSIFGCSDLLVTLYFIIHPSLNRAVNEGQPAC